ncbi:MAG: glycosyltransferase [Candidatus Brocadiales bacterium]
MISIILTSYNRAEFLRDSLQTLVEQNYPGTAQLILCDDGSTDRALEVAEEFRRDFDDFQIIQEHPPDEQRLREVRYVKLINKALPLCKGKYITYATDDDLYHPQRNRTLVEFLETHPEVFLVYHYMKVFKVSREKDYLETIWDLSHPWTPGLKYWVENIWNYIDHSAVMHRNMFAENILWDDNPRYMKCGDWGFLKRVLAADKEFAHVPEHLAVGRKIEGMSVHFDGVERYEETVRCHARGSPNSTA